MKNAANYIEDKVEEFRLAGKKPAYLGLNLEVYTQLNSELKPKERNGGDPEAKITKFINLPVVVMAGPQMPKDGVYIHEI